MSTLDLIFKGHSNLAELVLVLTLNLGYKGHWNLAELVLTLILLTILTSFDPKPNPYFLTLKLSYRT